MAGDFQGWLKVVKGMVKVSQTSEKLQQNEATMSLIAEKKKNINHFLGA